MSFLAENQTLSYFGAHPVELAKFQANIVALKIKSLLGTDINLQKNHKSAVPIDIVMPTLDRDYEVVREVVDSLRENIKHPIGQIIIISPPSKKIETLCKEKKCKWINENTVLPITIKDIDFVVNGVNRSGWIFQQLLKWAASKYVQSDYFLVTESDTVYARPHVFIHQDKTILACSTAIPHIPYFQAYKRLYGESIPAIYNLTSHHLLFKKEYLAEAKNKIEQYCDKPWFMAILANLDTTQISSVSDYDSYGQYVVQHHPESITFEHWANRSFPRTELKNLKDLVKKYAPNTKTLSFHSYNE
jgi:hypothetical protein